VSKQEGKKCEGNIYRIMYKENQERNWMMENRCLETEVDWEKH
jgi:hypothetical protein